jgi:hypothetical protein
VARRPKYTQLYDNDTVEIRRGREFVRQCCDCGLVHAYNYKIIYDKRGKPQIQYKVRRDKRATAAVRKRASLKGLVIPNG